MEDIRDRVRRLGKEKGLSQGGIEKVCGLSAGYVSKLNKINPSADVLQRMSEYFHVSVDYLLTGREEMNYYFNDDAREVIEFLHNNPDYGVLFDSVRSVKKKDIKLVKRLLDRLAGGEE